MLSSTRWLVALLTLSAGGVAYAVLAPPPESVPVHEPEALPAPPPEVVAAMAPPPSLAAGGNTAEAAKQRRRERFEVGWAEVVRLEKEVKHAEALEAWKRLAKELPELAGDPARLAVVSKLETAVLAGRKQAELAKALRVAKLSEAQRELLDGKLAATAEVLARSGNEADLDQLTRHLRRFLLPGSPGSGGAKDGADQVLRSFIEDRRKRRKDDKNPPVADVDEAERRRVDELEKLRQRNAIGLLDSIHAGLAWLALHQRDDGSFSDQATVDRCTALKHDPGCLTNIDSTGDSYMIAATGLAVLAFLDFRDQDPNGWFDPYLGRGVEYLRSKQKPDGTWPSSGQQYSNAIALMALAQAAQSTGTEELRVAVRKGLAWFDTTQGPLGGYRYQRDDPRGDLSVTGWVAQAVEAARNAGIEIPPRLAGGFEIFLRYVWLGDVRFSYVYGGGASPALAPVGMLVGHVVGKDKDPATAEAWKKYLLGLKPDRPPELYGLYYGVRLSILMNNALEEPFRTWTFDLAKKQVQAASAAGSIPVRMHGNMKTGLVVPTALAILTLEHALYLR